MLKRLGFHFDEVALALMVWLCTLPLVGLIVIPLFGLKVAGVVALALLVVVVIICWGICSWKIYKG